MTGGFVQAGLHNLNIVDTVPVCSTIVMIIFVNFLLKATQKEFYRIPLYIFFFYTPYDKG